jgi:hypothetical protein
VLFRSYKRAQDALRTANEFMVARAVKLVALEEENEALKKKLGLA